MIEVEEWIKKAEADLRIAKKLLELDEESWAIAFHIEQAVEKFLKAFLIYKKRRFRKTHNIKEILDLCIEIDKDFEKLREINVEYLTEYATSVRYPGVYEPSKDEVIEAIEIAEKVREFILKKIKFKEGD